MTTTQTPAAPAPAVPDRLGDSIIRVSSSEWFVRSRRSAPGSYWRVQTTDVTVPVCGCPAGRDTFPADGNRSARACHHFRVAVDFEIKRDRLAHPRPTGPPAPASMFVD